MLAKDMMSTKKNCTEETSLRYHRTQIRTSRVRRLRGDGTVVDASAKVKSEIVLCSWLWSSFVSSSVVKRSRASLLDAALSGKGLVDATDKEGVLSAVPGISIEAAASGAATVTCSSTSLVPTTADREFSSSSMFFQSSRGKSRMLQKEKRIGP